MEDHPLQVRHKQEWGQGCILLLLETAVLPGSHVGNDGVESASGFVILNARLRALYGVQRMGHAIRTWSTACSRVPHSQFGEKTTEFVVGQWNHPTVVRKQLRQAQVVQGKLNPTGLALILGIKARSLDVFSQYSVFHL